MTRFAALIAFSALAASPALAGIYSAKLLAPPAASRIAGKDIGWTCAAGDCRGRTEASRPILLCQDLAKRAGRVESFVADGTPLPAEQLAKCNASAKGGVPAELAKAN